MVFKNILYPPDAVLPQKVMSPPKMFIDLGLDQLVDRIGRNCKELWPFYTPVHEEATIGYRQAIMQDLEDSEIRRRFVLLSQRLLAIQKQLSAHGMEHLPYVQSRTLLAAASQYISHLEKFSADFPYSKIHSEGLLSFLLYIRQVLSDQKTVRMRMEVFNLEWKLQKVNYTVLLKGKTIKVKKKKEEDSLDDFVKQLFDRFQQDNFGGATCQAPAGETDIKNENAVLSLLSYEYPELFEKLLNFGESYRGFVDPELFQFASEVQFYLSYLDNIDRIKRYGGTFCYPEVVNSWDGCHTTNCFDLTLAENLSDQQSFPVTNGFELRGNERILVITGPNQGGKTTYARMLGQLFYLASLGVCVPGDEAVISLPDIIYTHFAKVEKTGANNLRFELLRLKEILDHATDKSMILVNEIFASISHNDGLYLGKQMMKQFSELRCMVVCVTFLDELALYGPETVSIIGQVMPGKSRERSYIFSRHAPNGRAYALSLAEKKGLTYEQIMERITK